MKSPVPCPQEEHGSEKSLSIFYVDSLVALNGDASPPLQMAQSQGIPTSGPTVEEEEGVLLEDDHPVVAGVLVRAATLPALSRLLVRAFDSHGQVAADRSNLPSMVLRMHRWFTTSVALADVLMNLHRQASEVAPCSIPDCSHRNGDADPKKCPQLLLQMQVCHTIRFWITQFPMHFDLEPDLSNLFRDFQAALSPTSAQLVDLSQVPTYEWMRQVSVRNSLIDPTQSSGQHSRKVSLVFNHLQPLQLAEHLTFLEHKVMRRITFQELRNYVHSNSLQNCPKLERSVSLFNGLTQWIQCMVLSRTTPQQRAEVIAKFIDVAQKLRELQNFNSLMSVVGAVSHSVLARLSRTMACLSPDKKRLLSELTELLSSTNNFGAYRRELSTARGFKIPILGIHLKDLVALHVALPDRLDGEMLNMRKMAQLSLIFQELERLQQAQPPIDANMDLVNTLRLSLDLAYTEDEIYELSLAREPRNSSSPQYSPTQSVLFAEWASSPCPPPDPQTIEKHVNAMVEAVFKNYDNDRDGYISHDEFEAVAGNFPFIASFCVLDADHDGMISQWEMKKYFIHANCHALKSGFKHEFHETTYFKPTFCSHCAGLLWGLIRQGYKCRDCGISAHKQCKDLVVMECRARSCPTTGDPSSHATNSRRRFRRKKKSSLSESESSPSSPKYSTCDSESSVAERLGNGGGSLPSSPKPGGAWTGPRRKISDSLLVPSQSRLAARLRPQNSCPESSCGRHPSLLAHQTAILQPPMAIHQNSLPETNVRCHPRLAHQAAVAQPSLVCNHSISELPQDGETSEILPPSQQSSASRLPTGGQQTGSNVNAVPTHLPVNQSSTNQISVQPSDEIQDLHNRLRVVEEANQRLLRENHFLLQQLENAYGELNSLREHVGEVRQHTIAFILRQMETLHIQKDSHV